MYLTPLNITITKAAEALCISRKAVSAIVDEQESVTPEMALRLSKAFDTTPDLWLNLQKKYDLWCAMNDKQGWKEVEPLYQASATA